MINITINDQVFKADEYECSPLLIDTGNRVRTLDGVDHVENRKVKRQVKAAFTDMKRTDLHRLISACSGAYLTVTYFDTIHNQEETRIFILQNNPSIPMKIWKSHMQYYTGIMIELLEKGASTW